MGVVVGGRGVKLWLFSIKTILEQEITNLRKWQNKKENWVAVQWVKPVQLATCNVLRQCKIVATLDPKRRSIHSCDNMISAQQGCLSSNVSVAVFNKDGLYMN